MKELIVLTEEPTGRDLFCSMAKKLGFDGKITVLTHSGIGELRKSVERKINAHPNKNAKFLVIFDQDNSVCEDRKKEFVDLVPEVLKSRVRFRVACREIESWLIAQPAALKSAGLLKRDFSNSLLSRNPDHIHDPKRELLRHTHTIGQQALMRKFAPKMDIDEIKSPSFVHTVLALRWAMT